MSTSYNFTSSSSMRASGRFRRREARLISLRGITKRRPPFYMQLSCVGTKKLSWWTPLRKPVSFPSSRCNSGVLSSLTYYLSAYHLLILWKTRIFTTSIASQLNTLIPGWILSHCPHRRLDPASHCVSLGNVWIVCGNQPGSSGVSSPGCSFDVYGQPRAHLSYRPRRQLGIYSVHRDRHHEKAHRVHVQGTRRQEYLE
jgi:hypothetical protein